MKNLFERYLALPHTRQFRDVSLADFKYEIESRLNHLNISGLSIYLSDNDPIRFALTFLKLIELGASPIPVSPGHQRRGEAHSYLKDLNWQHQNLSAARTANCETYVCLSSGTTGEPKKILLSTTGALINAKNHGDGFELGPGDRIIQTLPIHHSYGIVAYIFTPLVFGLGVDFCPGIVGLRSFKSISDHQRILHVSPSQARFILKDPFTETRGLTKISVGAGALNFHELSVLNQKLPHIQFYVSYGLTEAGPRVTAGKFSNSIKKFKDGWIGSVLNDIQACVFREGKVESFGEGLLCVKTPCLMKNLAPSDFFGEWLKTRDMVQIDEDGEIYFLSRSDDIIKCGGVSIYPFEMENTIQNFQGGMTDVLVLKRSDPLYDEVPILFIEGEINRAALDNFINDHFPQALAPREIHILKKFPRLSLNKVDRTALKSMIAL